MNDLYITDGLENGLEFIAGVGNTASFGISGKVTDNYNELFHGRRRAEEYSRSRNCSGWHTAGEYAGFLVGAGRLAYAGAAKGLSQLAARKGMTEAAARAAVANRNLLKRIFRLNPFSKFRIYPFEKIFAKYGNNPAAVIAAAGRTNGSLNKLGAFLALSGSFVAGSDCE